MTASLQQAFEKASALPADVQEFLAKGLLAEIETFQARVNPAGELPPLPAFNAGAALVDLANREALYEVLERHSCS